ncbi:MAG: diguanylate cyclase/phosphodiesterase [Frankiales bacterium]|nr:diguanylate cyclase/phosphodiesterase [Frankiales bacterium]
MYLFRSTSVRDGGSLRVRLLALVLVPLVGVGLAAAVGVGSRVSSVRSASGAEEHIRSAAAMGVARNAFEQEVLPGYSATAAKNQPLIGAVTNTTPTGTFGVAGAIIAQLPTLRTATDAAVAALARYPSVADAGRDFRAELAKIRARMDDPKTIATAMTDVNSFMAAMASTEYSQVIAATKDGIDAVGIQALHDVDLTMRATQAGAQELILFSGTQFVINGSTPVLDAAWAQAWGTYAGASAAVAQQSTPSIAAKWAVVNADPAVSEFNRYLASQLTSTTAVSVTRMIDLIIEDGSRNKAYMTVLSYALDRALAAGRVQRHQATLDLAWIIAAALLLVLISVAIAAVIKRSVSRPLDRLAEQATRISLGELTDVQVSGPREVRTVARALSSSVASLRNIEAQAAAVTAGDLDNPVVRQALPGPLGQVVHSSVASIISAIHDREIAQGELAHRAAHDALTELPNRAQALVLIEQALHRAQRSSTKTALMFIDLDHFKTINDNFGHAAGDEVLRSVARRMLQVVRDGDSVARLGGDEFVVLLENISDEADIVRLAERLVEQVSAEMVVDERAMRVGTSVGIAFCRDGYVDADRLLQEADAAAYRAKNAGRGRVDIFDDGLRAELAFRADLEHAIAAGLEKAEFVLYYQAIIDLNTRETVGVEALIRWMRPGHGMVPPDEFIPVAERSTLINDIGRWVLREATQQLARWVRTGAVAADLSMAVNISGRHLGSNQLLNDVTDALESSGVDPRQLIVELTETVLVDDPIATNNMQSLRTLGVQIAIDDFGTGFTSIGQLPRLPVDTLKIDRSFVASADPAHQELVRLIVSAAHAFGLSVVAEGIEYEHQADRLRDADVECGQGFLYAHPKPATALFNSGTPSEASALPRSVDG